MTPDKKKQNLRLAIALGSVAAALFIGFIAKFAILGG